VSKAVVSPATLVVSISTVILGWVAIKQHDGLLLAAIFTLGTSVAAGILGAVIWDRWIQLTGRSVLVDKGKSAIRSLKLLWGNLNACQGRVTTYLDRRKTGVTGDIVNTWLEEEIQRLATLQEEALNAISNWTDIIPEADVTAQLAPYRELQASVLTLKTAKEELEAHLKRVSGVDTERALELNRQYRRRDAELEEVKKQLATEAVRLGTSVLSGLSDPPASMVKTGLDPLQSSEIHRGLDKIKIMELFGRCEQCGEKFTTDQIGQSRCLACRQIAVSVKSL
ncbi:MAG: hypothetical protein ACE1ZI_01315, partial [Acidobacteriota bacterium]